MFGLFGSKKKSAEKDDFDSKVAKSLFSQIELARDEAKAGGIVDEKVFNDRLNSMYVAGYLIGYVDSHISSFTDDDAAKKKHAECIFETMFPGAGMDFIKEKLAIRTKAKNIAANADNYAEMAARCHAFDTGMEDAEKEVDNVLKNTDYQPIKLKEFLLLGER